MSALEVIKVLELKKLLADVAQCLKAACNSRFGRSSNETV
jgi:hypothetical protein